MITCPECKTDYEKEAKFCFKCRIAFTDDIPENISKYLKRNTSSGSLNKNISMTDNKPPLNRNTSSGGIKTNIQISSGTPPSSSSQSPIITNNVTSSPVNSTSSPLVTNTSTGNLNSARPRLASSPTPPTHPLPPTPTRNSVPIPMNNPSNPTTSNNTPNTVSPKPPLPASTINSSGANSVISNKIISPNSSSDNFTPISPTSTHNTDQSALRRPISTRIPPPPPSQKLARAIWDCIPEQKGDLSFKEGDIIIIISKDFDGSGWWRGKVQGSSVEGLFPGNYTVEIE